MGLEGRGQVVWGMVWPRECLETWDLRRYLELATGVLRRGGWFLQWELEDGEGKKGIIWLEVSTWGLCIVYCSADYMILFMILFYCILFYCILILYCNLMYTYTCTNIHLIWHIVESYNTCVGMCSLHHFLNVRFLVTQQITEWFFECLAPGDLVYSEIRKGRNDPKTSQFTMFHGTDS